MATTTDLEAPWTLLFPPPSPGTLGTVVTYIAEVTLANFQG